MRAKESHEYESVVSLSLGLRTQGLNDKSPNTCFKRVVGYPFRMVFGTAQFQKVLVWGPANERVCR